MKIAAIQIHSVLGGVDENYASVDKAMKDAVHQGAELLVLPEMWNTAFYPSNVKAMADIKGQRTQQFLSAFAEHYGVAIVGGSVATRQKDGLYNTTYVVDHKGQVVSEYNKVHLFSLGKEGDFFRPGNKANVFTLNNTPMASLICYDIRFPEWARTAALAGAQVLFVPAAWPRERLAHWRVLNTARAIENQCFVVAVNACGPTGEYTFAGHSLVIDPLGNILAEAGESDEILCIDMDVTAAQRVRESMHIFADRRPALYTKD